MFLAWHLPQPNAETGRRAYTNDQLLPGILLVLRTGCRWEDLDRKERQLSGVTHWRRLKYWQTHAGFSKIWDILLTALQRGKILAVQTLSLDGTFIPSFAFKEMTGYSGKEHKTGVKLSFLVDGNGVPLSVVSAPGNYHDLSLAQETFTTLHISYRYTLGSTLLADKGYDSQYFRLFLKQRDIKDNIVPKHHAGPGPPFDAMLAKQRYVVERSNAWIKSFRRLRFRFDRTKRFFEAFVLLAILVILVRKAFPQ